jgi:hypothetical protein
MQVTREEAQIFLNLIGDGATTDGTMDVLYKINKAYPDVLRGTKYPALIRDHQEARQKVVKSAMARISEFIADAKASVAKAEEVAKKANVGFSLCLGDEDASSFFDPKDGWSSSNC